MRSSSKGTGIKGVMKIDLDPRDVIALEQQEPYIRRAVAAERQLEEATDRTVAWIAEAARQQDLTEQAEHRVQLALDQRNWWLVAALVLAGLNVFQFVAARVAQ